MSEPSGPATLLVSFHTSSSGSDLCVFVEYIGHQQKGGCRSDLCFAIQERSAGARWMDGCSWCPG